MATSAVYIRPLTAVADKLLTLAPATTTATPTWHDQYVAAGFLNAVDKNDKSLYVRMKAVYSHIENNYNEPPIDYVNSIDLLTSLLEDVKVLNLPLSVVEEVMRIYMFLMFLQYRTDNAKLFDKHADPVQEYINIVSKFNETTVKTVMSIGHKFMAGMLFFHLLHNPGTSVSQERLQTEFKDNDEKGTAVMLLGVMHNLLKYLTEKPKDVLEGTYDYYKLLLEFVERSPMVDMTLFSFSPDYCEIGSEFDDMITKAARDLSPLRMALAEKLAALTSRARIIYKKKIYAAKVESAARHNQETSPRRAASAIMRIEGILGSTSEEKGKQAGKEQLNARLKSSGIQLEGGGDGGEFTLSNEAAYDKNTLLNMLCAEAMAISLFNSAGTPDGPPPTALMNSLATGSAGSPALAPPAVTSAPGSAGSPAPAVTSAPGSAGSPAPAVTSAPGSPAVTSASAPGPPLAAPGSPAVTSAPGPPSAPGAAGSPAPAVTSAPGLPAGPPAPPLPAESEIVKIVKKWVNTNVQDMMSTQGLTTQMLSDPNLAIETCTKLFENKDAIIAKFEGLSNNTSIIENLRSTLLASKLIKTDIISVTDAAKSVIKEMATVVPDLITDISTFVVNNFNFVNDPKNITVKNKINVAKELVGLALKMAPKLLAIKNSTDKLIKLAKGIADMKMAGGAPGAQSVKDQILGIRKHIRDFTGDVKSVQGIIKRYNTVLDNAGLVARIKELRPAKKEEAPTEAPKKASGKIVQEHDLRDKTMDSFATEYGKLKEDMQGVLKEISATIQNADKQMDTLLSDTTSILSIDATNSVFSKKKELLKRYIEGNFDEKRDDLNYGSSDVSPRYRTTLIDTGLKKVLLSIEGDIKSAFQTALKTMEPIGEPAWRALNADMKKKENGNGRWGWGGAFTGGTIRPVDVGGNDPEEEDDAYFNAKTKLKWVLDNVTAVFSDSLAQVDRFAKVHAEGTIVGDTSLLTTLFSKYVENKEVNGELLAGKALSNELEANDLMPASVLAIDSTDKFIFIAVTMFIRLTALYITYYLAGKGIVKKLGYAMLVFIALYVFLLFAMAMVVNLSEYHLRIMFNFMNFHINDTGFYTYIGVAIVFTFAIVMLMTFVNFPFTNMGNDYTNMEERDKMMARLELVTSFIWLLLAILVIIT